MIRRVLLFVLIVCFPFSVWSQKKRLFDYNEGLSNSLINQVYQDHLGFIWVATENGLNRFDGIQFKTFRGENDDEDQLKANFVTALFEDTKNNLWVGQINGLQVYNHSTETFKEVEIYINNEQIHPYVSDITETQNGEIWITTSRYGIIKIDNETGRPRYSTRLNQQMCSFYLECIFADDKGVLWIGSDNNGLSTYDLNSGAVHNFSNAEDAPYYLPGNDITDICEDTDGNVYISSLKSGLLRYHKQSQKVERIASSEKNEYNLPVKSLLFDSKNRLWAGTDGKGLYRLNAQTDKLEKMHPGSSSFDFSKSKIHSVIEDNTGNIWLGVFQKGLYLFPESPEMFNHYGYRAFGENSIGSNSITALEGSKGVLWIGTDGDGIYRMNRENSSIQPIHLKNTSGETEGNNVLSLYDSKDGYLWIGTFFNGLLRYNTQTGQLKSYKNNPADSTSLINDKVTHILAPNADELWLTTLGGGICRFNKRTQTFHSGLNWPDSLNQLIPVWTNDIYMDSLHNVWIGTYDGLVHANLKNNSLTLYTTENNFLPHNVVYSISPDSRGNIWVGTYGGLVKINLATLESQSFSTANGLGSNVICGTVEDAYHKIWISTHNGLSLYNPADSSMTTYYASDGLQANEFSRKSFYKSPDNELFFGGINGVSEVKKDYFNYRRSIHDVMLTDFLLFNKPVPIGQKTGKRILLKQSIVMADTVHLLERDNVFSIGFTSTELANQSRISYEYKMVGFDDSWNLSNSLSRTATYTNLAHGTYHFLVRGVDKGQYSTPRELTIIIHPPWYKTKPAMILWVLLVVVFFYGIILFNQEKVRHREAEKINEKKMQFFINISHEIKTPLSLILDPLEKLMHRKNSEETLRLYRTMNINANRIYRLVSQLLDLRKIDKGQLLVKFQKTNLPAIIDEIAQSYSLLAESKRIIFTTHHQQHDLDVWIDPLNFEKVILNLLSNAFKYTPDGGSITINTGGIHNKGLSSDTFTHAQIIVSDSGVGIKRGELEKVFERFYQVSSNENRHNTGTGIGLHLSRSLVALHKGRLYAENRPDGKGTNFIILLPLGTKHLPKEDLILEENFLPTPGHGFVDAETVENQAELTQQSAKSGYKVMIVDDEEEILNYLTHELGSIYQVCSCKDGVEAMEQLEVFKPDLILSDIMMPRMDGIALCKKIKGNIETSHIPVILLTALSKDEDRAEGIDTGADMYLVKPFNSNLLKKTIANLLDNRRKIHQQLAKKGSGAPIDAIKMKSNDEILMQKVMTIIKENLSDSKLNVEMLADGVGISRVHMHRKLKELTNQSARDFIKNIRMKQAAYILTNKKLNISEVAYAVGYANLSHFSSSFKSFYGISPKEYVINNSTNQN